MARRPSATTTGTDRPDSGGFVVAYPNGVLRAWNGGTCCGAPESFDIDHVGFITDMVATIQRRTPIDPARVYATGMSAGAIMALRLGCQSDKFAAIAPVAGTLLTDCAHTRPTSVLQIHGTADDRVPYNGGPGAAARSTALRVSTAPQRPRSMPPGAPLMRAHRRPQPLPES